MRLRDLLTGAVLLLAPEMALAHPHEWVDVASEIVFDAQGRIAAVRHHWRFDEGFSTFALQGLDADGDGMYSPEELQPLAHENVESLADFEFFTFISAGDYKAGFGAPKEYHLDLDGDRLTLHFTLPLAQPLFTKGEVLLQVYDPEYYIAFSLPAPEAVRFVEAPAGCRLEVFPAKEPEAAAAAALATVGPDQRELPAELQDLATGIDNSAEINCGDAASLADADGAAVPQDASEAMAELADAAGQSGDLSALAAEPTRAAQRDGSAAAVSQPALRPTPMASTGVFAKLGAMQAAFNHQLTAALKNLSADGSAFWWLGGISFFYGIVHAAGPGHGKVVISSYLLANEQRVRRGVAVAFLSALVQALVAVGLVGFMAALLNMTSMAITDTARLFETGSFALVTGLGLYLVVRKGRTAWATWGGADPRPVREHHHAPIPHQHGPGCSCHHASPAALEKLGLSGAAAAVFAVGLRPCSGALVVLVFALAQGIFWAGIVSTFLMALGTAMTVAALAALAVGAKDLAGRFSRGNGRRPAQIMLGLEMAAALFITALGLVLLGGSLSA